MPAKPANISLGGIKTALALTIQGMENAQRPDPDRIAALKEGHRIIAQLAGLKARLKDSPGVAIIAQIVQEGGWPGNPLEARYAPDGAPWTKKEITDAIVAEVLAAMKG